jgi:hypothetical protein
MFLSPSCRQASSIVGLASDLRRQVNHFGCNLLCAPHTTKRFYYSSINITPSGHVCVVSHADNIGKGPETSVKRIGKHISDSQLVKQRSLRQPATFVHYLLDGMELALLPST